MDYSIPRNHNCQRQVFYPLILPHLLTDVSVIDTTFNASLIVPPWRVYPCLLSLVWPDSSFQSDGLPPVSANQMN